MMNCRLIILSMVLLMTQYNRTLGQIQRDNLQELIDKMIMDKELNTIFYSYNHFGDSVLFMAYNEVIKNAMDTSKYVHLDSWKYHIMMNFSGNRVYLAGYGYLLGKLINYYVQLDEIIIEEREAKIKFRTNTTGQKVNNLFYFVGEINFEKRQDDNWCITRKQLMEKD